ncbi:hypothetical protein SMC26_19280 [Actinomadura fulvescens]|uniref:FAD-binding domain-containing protein n=1 Tax=Actinomadura fulvescens TaxID=46160 RepID=A0ABN3QGF1_9ACTN
MHADVDRCLTELDRSPAFYFDSITQLHMDAWSHGRVTLVGDAGYRSGPAVGGSTSLAVLGAYVLAGELAQAGGDHQRAYPACEREMAELVRRSRTFARRAASSPTLASASGQWPKPHAPSPHCPPEPAERWPASTPAASGSTTQCRSRPTTRPHRQNDRTADSVW